jgi:hypothetical protein
LTAEILPLIYYKYQKGKASDYLPPELRQAGLLAHQSVAKGKCFGPFRGQISKTGKKPDENYSFVCEVNNKNKMTTLKIIFIPLIFLFLPGLSRVRQLYET